MGLRPERRAHPSTWVAVLAFAIALSLPFRTTPAASRGPSAAGFAGAPNGGITTSVSPLALGQLQPGVDDPQRIHEVTREVLRRPEYQWAQPSIFQRAAEFVFRQIARLLSMLGWSARGANAVGWLIVTVGVILLGVLTVFSLRRLSPSRDVTEQAMAAEVLGADEWRAAAERHEAAGNWKEAVRCRYRALVLDLVERGLIDELPGRTAGEYEHQVRGALPTAAQPFSDATMLFQWVWYGTARSTPDDVRRLRELSERVLAAAT